MKKNIDAGTNAIENAKLFGGYLTDHFIQLVVVGVSATQTFYLIQSVAPQWATWLPVFAVLLMEGGYLFWMWREFEADIADGSLADIEKNAQEIIANRMVYVTLGLSVITMLAGGFLEIANSDLAYLLQQFPVLANYLALVAIGGVFILGGVHLFADWRYRRADPDVSLDRVHRANMRALARQRQQALAEVEEKVTLEEVKETRRLGDANKQHMGVSRAKKHFDNTMIEYAEDTKGVSNVNPQKGQE